jgi:protein-tyrosine phosphatase
MRVDEVQGSLTRVLFVCRGNICRSPMAEALFTKLLDEQGQLHVFEVDSAGTSGFNKGKATHPNTLAVLASRGVEFSHTSRPVVDGDYVTFDHILTMDHANFQDVMARCPEDMQAKVHPILEPLGGGVISDPYELGLSAYEECFEQLQDLLPKWVDRLIGVD